jgi:hypothetical protein
VTGSGRKKDGAGMARQVARQLLAVLGGLASLLIVIPMGLVLLPLWVVAALTRALARNLGPQTLDWTDFVQFEPEVGWKPRPNKTGWATDLNGDAFHITTDSAGWRAAGELNASDIVVIGDSFAFGFAVDDEDFFARRVPGAVVASLGAPGYSIVQPVLWLERLADQLAGKVVVILVYMGNDLAETVRPSMEGYRAPFVRVGRDGGCEVMTKHVRPDPWPFPRQQGMDEYIDICLPGAASERAFAACEFLLGRARRACDSAGASLVVMTIPELSPAAREALAVALEPRSDRERFDEELPERRLAEICEELGIPLVALRDHLGPEHYLERDFHWNPAGHRRVAEVLASLARAGAAIPLDGRARRSGSRDAAGLPVVETAGAPTLDSAASGSGSP